MQEQCDNIMNSVNPNYIMTDDINLCKEYIHTIIYEFEGVLLCSLEYKQEEKNLDDVSLMMCTSGTTGRPKASLFSPEALQYNVAAIIDYFPLTNADTILISRPIYHSAVLVGEVLVSLSVGANIIFYSGEYNPIIICNILDRYNITASCGTPTIFKGISSCLSHRREIGKLHTIVLSGEYLLQEYAEDIRKCFPYTKIFNVYGLTEAGPRVSYLSPEKFDLIPQSVGQSLNGVEIKIVNEKGIEMSAYEKGKVWVKTPSLMLGYYQDILLTNNKIQNGWFDTGDIGMLGGHFYCCIS